MSEGSSPPIADILWRPSSMPRRGPKPKHTLENIADTAITIADAEGLDAVTMQRVAARLGTTKMSLYRYVPGRAELDAVMLDRALGMPTALPDRDWRSALTTWARELHARVAARPWTVELSQRPHTPGPFELAWFETALGAMAGLSLRGGEKLDLLVLLVGHVMSIVRQDAQSSTPEADLAAGLEPILDAHAVRYPHTAAAFTDAAAADAREDAMRFGLERILAGVSTLHAGRT